MQSGEPNLHNLGTRIPTFFHLKLTHMSHLGQQRDVMVPWYDALFATNPPVRCVAPHNKGCFTAESVPGMS